MVSVGICLSNLSILSNSGRGSSTEVVLELKQFIEALGTGNRRVVNLFLSCVDGMRGTLGNRAMHWVPMPMGFGWAWVRY